MPLTEPIRDCRRGKLTYKTNTRLLTALLRLREIIDFESGRIKIKIPESVSFISRSSYPASSSLNVRAD